MTHPYIEFELHDYDDLIEDVSHAPSLHTIEALERTLTEAFGLTQAVVHVRTGRLKASGHVSSTVSDGKWEGSITYGFPGVVEYAIYEQRRGGAHDFIKAAYDEGSHFAAAIAETWIEDDHHV